jgi:uncharacterized protein YegP (UPF0339 family)
MSGYYELKTSGSQFMWNLKSANHETILTSERYTSKDGAKRGIESCKANSGLDARYERKTSSNGQPYFVLRGANFEVIGTSETYSSTWARDAGITTCKANGPTAATVDRT